MHRFRAIQHFRPCIDRIAREARRRVRARIDRGHELRVLQSVVAERPGKRDDMPPVNNSAPERSAFRFNLVEVDARRVLPKAGGKSVFRLLQGDAVDMINAFPDFIVVPKVGAAGESAIVGSSAEALGDHQLDCGDAGLEFGNNCLRRGRGEFALRDHYPAAKLEHRIAILIVTLGPDIDDAGCPVRCLTQADHLRHTTEGVAREYGTEKTAFSVTQVCNSIERNVRNRFSEDDVECCKFVEWAARQSAGSRERVGTVERKSMRIERSNECPVAVRYRSRRDVGKFLASKEIFKEVSPKGFFVHGVDLSREQLSTLVAIMAFTDSLRLGRLRAKVLLALAILVVHIGTVAAAEFHKAQELFRAGAFLEAHDTAIVFGTPEGHALAIQSLTAHGLFQRRKEERRAVYARAVTLSEQALKRWPKNADLMVEAARALGRYGDSVGNLVAFEESIGIRARDYLVTALELVPDHAEATAALGAWHARLVGEGGILAAVLFGASAAKGRELMARAEPQLLENVPLLYELARAWRSIGDTAHARRLLELANAAENRGVYVEYHRKRVRKLLEDLQGE